MVEDETLLTADYETAALMSHQCRAAGVTGPLTDFLIIEAAARNEAGSLTLDRDFARYAGVPDVRLHPWPG